MKYYFLILLSLVIISCAEEEVVPITEQEVATKWATMTTFITHHTSANSPTYASRCLGYIGLTMYESIVHGYEEYQSVAPQLNGFAALPTPETDAIYDWKIALNAGQALILKSLYNQTNDANKFSIDSLEAEIHNSLKATTSDKKAVKRSVAYGQAVAQQIFEWAKTDGGHRGYLKNFDKSYEHPTHAGAWQPPLYAQSFSHHPLHPHWGKNRTFLKENDNLPLPKMIPYDTVKGSDYYKEFLAVYQKDKILNQQEKEMAIWWGDDPDETFTPPGHSYYLATQTLQTKQPSLIKCAETYAKLGMGLADAFRNCWKWKYHFFSERPNTFIPKYIDPEFESFWPDPPFPCFPSGHAIQASTFATTMMGLYGNEFSFTDSSHVGRRRDDVRDVDFVAQQFDSFWAVAQETADSRFYGGIHTPQDNRVGLEEGVKIATNVSKLRWKK